MKIYVVCETVTHNLLTEFQFDAMHRFNANVFSHIHTRTHMNEFTIIKQRSEQLNMLILLKLEEYIVYEW